MRRADLVLWMLIYPWSTIAAGIAMLLLVYFFAWPRKTRALGELPVEGWRLLAIAAGVPAFFLGAELMLWLRDLAFRAPLVFTGLPWALGLQLLFLSPLPFAVAWVRKRPTAGRPTRSSLGMAALGLLLMFGGQLARDRAWNGLVASAASDEAALDQLVMLKAYRYASPQEASAALDALLPAAADVLTLVDRHEEVFDPELRDYVAARLEGALERDPEELAGRSPAAVRAMWTLTGDSLRTLRAYALSVEELRAEALPLGAETERASPPEIPVQKVGLHAMSNAPEPVAAVVVQALVRPTWGEVLDAELIEALAAEDDASTPAGATALALLLRDGSRRALRPILPRFVDASGARADYEGPVWAVLRRDCMSQTTALRALQDDEDPRVAAGATEVLKYVRQYCSKRFRNG